MIDRFQTDVFDNAPDLVIWQTGTVEAMGEGAVDPFLGTLRSGSEQIRAHGADLLFMDSQFYSGVGVSAHYQGFQTAMAAFARQSGAAMVPRYALMGRYVGVGLYPLAALLASDSFHPSDLTYRCLGEYTAAGLSG